MTPTLAQLAFAIRNFKAGYEADGATGPVEVSLVVTIARGWMLFFHDRGQICTPFGKVTPQAINHASGAVVVTTRIPLYTCQAINEAKAILEQLRTMRAALDWERYALGYTWCNLDEYQRHADWRADKARRRMAAELRQRFDTIEQATGQGRR
jgi:hypothetical protein